NIGNTDNGDYMFFTGVNFGSGTVKSLNFRIASAATFTGYADIRIDSATGTIIGTVAFGSTGGWQNWVTRKVPVTAVSGVKNVYITFRGDSPSIGNVNWFQFSTNDLSVNAFTQIEAESYSSMLNLQNEACSDTGGGIDVSWTDTGDYMVFNNVNFNSAAAKSLQFRIASAATFTGNAEIRLGSTTGTLIATVPFGNTGGWQTWITRKVPVSAVTGIQNVYVVFTGGNGIGNINWLQFSTEDLSPSLFSKIEAETYSSTSGLATEATSDTGGGLNVGSSDAGDYMVFNSVNFGTGTAKSLSFRIASAATFTGYADVRLDSPTGTLIASVPFGNTGGWQT
ncbi:MAG: carbohydrate-binding protein, partial [Sphingobacteriales bacterium]